MLQLFGQRWWKILLLKKAFWLSTIPPIHLIWPCAISIGSESYIWPWKKSVMQTPRCKFWSAARVGPSGHGWPYSGDQGLVIIVGPTVVVSVLLTLAANTGNRRCARPSAQLWPRLELTVGPTLANCFRWPWQFSRPTSGPCLNQSLAY